jgi:hypothetical protein
MSEAQIRNHCRHIHPSGHRCASPSLRHENFCYYHHTSRKPVMKSEAQTRQANQSTFILLEPDNRTAIQLNLGEIMRRIASKELDTKRAGLLLYALQIAACNLPKAIAEVPETIEEITVDEQLGPIAPESEYQTAPGRKSLEQILREQWAKDDAEEAEREAAREAKRAAEEESERLQGVPHDHATEGSVIVGEIPPQPQTYCKILPSIEAVADPNPFPLIRFYPFHSHSHFPKSQVRT